MILYRCDGCGKTREELSDSWREVELASFTSLVPTYMHFCLECISDKKEWPRDPAQ